MYPTSQVSSLTTNLQLEKHLPLHLLKLGYCEAWNARAVMPEGNEARRGPNCVATARTLVGEEVLDFGHAF